jgi:transcriptional regulator with XRE-family HTH domain
MANEFLYQVIGERIQAMRKMHNLTQEKLSESIHKSRSSIAQIESGRQKVSLELLYEIAQALKCSIHELLPDEKNLQVDPDSANRISHQAQAQVLEMLNQIPKEKE